MNYGEQNTSKVHIWVGNNFEKDYEEYFELDYREDVEIGDLDYKICSFCKDIGEVFYDEDWIGYTQHSQEIDLDILINQGELSVMEETITKIREICIKKGVEKANAVFWYYDGGIMIKDKEKLYNKLTYIGMFDAI
ncbi:immunity 22 family protein [Lysinibacillus sp. fls2-241-R2A-57]|uniref:immunity 22 family protein n=1 Tax=Lysinibacillus sp. fls2-241-R2A-57 TaxID=3040292 RepID=UPI002556E526|nr:immunity 22 family protein [Lysinibacillus sp. fls2-241-R2A-57]